MGGFKLRLLDTQTVAPTIENGKKRLSAGVFSFSFSLFAFHCFPRKTRY